MASKQQKQATGNEGQAKQNMGQQFSGLEISLELEFALVHYSTTSYLVQFIHR